MSAYDNSGSSNLSQRIYANNLDYRSWERVIKKIMEIILCFQKVRIIEVLQYANSWPVSVT